jgi:hypothetical protein
MFLAVIIRRTAYQEYANVINSNHAKYHSYERTDSHAVLIQTKDNKWLLMTEKSPY